MNGLWTIFSFFLKMGRILAIDYGLKRTGVATTDPLQIIASPLETVPTEAILSWLESYFTREDVEAYCSGGYQLNWINQKTHATKPVLAFTEQLKKAFPKMPVSTMDERFTSKIAKQSLILGGMKKKDRRKKENIDKVSASLILQSFLDQKRY